MKNFSGIPSYVSQTCNKANRILEETLKNGSTHLKQLAYKQLVLPSMEYCAAIWDPHHQVDIKKLEMVKLHALY